MVDVRDVEVVAPNLKRRLSGVTSTIVQLLPLQAGQVRIAALGPGLPPHLEKLRWWQAAGLLRRPRNRPHRVWHARRNIEMVAGIVLRDLLGAPLKLLFTSAAQRRHRAFTRALLRRMDRIVSTSERSAAYLELPSTVIMHGIDTDRFRPPDHASERFAATGLGGERAIGCFGRIRRQKGTDLFVDAMIELLPGFPEWTAIVTGRVTAGHDSFFEEQREKVAQAGLAGRILFLGEVDDIAAWYRRLSLYVAPPRNEGFGLTPLEAMASGVPVVASDAGAFPELIADGVTGRVVPAGRLDPLVEAIRPYLGDGELRSAAAAAALERARTRFPLQGEADRLAAVYCAMLEGATGARR